MFDFMFILIFHSLFIKMNEAITIDSYLLDVFNTRTKYTVDLRKTTSQAVYINQSDSVTFSCTAIGTSFYVALLRNDNELKRESVHHGQTGKLTVTYTQKDLGCLDAAKFTCRAGSIKEWPNITAIIIVKCPVLPVRFKSNNVNKIVGAKDLTFICEKSKDVETNEPYSLTIRKNDVVLRNSSMETFIELSFQSLKCEDMATYSCETETKRFTNFSRTDLFVHYCPPLLSELKKTVTSDIGRSVNFHLKATMSRKLCVVTVLYKDYQTECDKCQTKLCAQIVSKENWNTQINITILNLTEEDFGNQNISICTETVGQLHCDNLSVIIIKDGNTVNLTENVNNTDNSTLETNTYLPTFDQSSNKVKGTFSKKGHNKSKTKTFPTQTPKLLYPGPSQDNTLSGNSNENFNERRPQEKNSIKTNEDKKINRNKRKGRKEAKKKKTNNMKKKKMRKPEKEMKSQTR